MPSFYLTEEAEALRLSKLVERIAKEGLRPGEAVPARILNEAARMFAAADEIEQERAAA